MTATVADGVLHLALPFQSDRRNVHPGVQRVAGRRDLLGTPDEECMPGQGEEAPVGEHLPEVRGRWVVLQEHAYAARLFTQPVKERPRRIEGSRSGISLAEVP
jgi:hypothetical protein